MSANVTSGGVVRQLDRKAAPDEQITEEQVQDPPRLARVLMDMLRDVAILKRRWTPKRLDFQGIVSTATDIAPQDFRLEHGFGGSVVWWPVKVVFTAGTTIVVPYIYELPTSSENTLILRVYYPGTLTIRVEEAGS